MLTNGGHCLMMLQLNQLVNQVLAANTDLAVAGINLQQARLQARFS